MLCSTRDHCGDGNSGGLVISSGVQDGFSNGSANDRALPRTSRGVTWQICVCQLQKSGPVLSIRGESSQHALRIA